MSYNLAEENELDDNQSKEEAEHEHNEFLDMLATSELYADVVNW